MEAMCHTLRERKSKFWIRERANEKGTCGKEKVGRNFSLESSGSIRWGERKNEGKKKREKKRKNNQ